MNKLIAAVLALSILAFSLPTVQANDCVQVRLCYIMEGQYFLETYSNCPISQVNLTMIVYNMLNELDWGYVSYSAIVWWENPWTAEAEITAAQIAMWASMGYWALVIGSVAFLVGTAIYAYEVFSSYDPFCTPGQGY